ncbi:MAG: sporulation protein [Brevibacillus sp.]|nr:sporulation protein [Brevibacillus sp.]
MGQLETEPEHQHMQQLDKLAEDFYQSTKQGDVERSRQQIDKIAELFPNITLPVTIRIESLNAVTQSILAAKQMFASPRVNEERLLWHATQVRIAIDALHHLHQPLWKQYQSSYMNQLHHLMEAAVQQDLNQFRAQFDENYYLYLVIRPGMGIHVKDQQMNTIDSAYDSVIRALRHTAPDWQVIRDGLRQLSAAMQAAFGGEERTAMGGPYVPASPYMLIFSVTAAVVLTLTYVGWKKYRAEQHA